MAPCKLQQHRDRGGHGQHTAREAPRNGTAICPAHKQGLRPVVPITHEPCHQTRHRQHPWVMLPHPQALLAHWPGQDHLKPVKLLQFMHDPGRW